jgi:hypothetical protein
MPTGAPNGSLWLDTDATSTTVFEQCWRKAITSAGTTISGNDDYSLALAYTVGFEQVYLNGVLLVRAVDYTATDGTSVVLATATMVGDYVEIITTATFTAANTYTQAAANAAFPLNTSSFFAGKNKIINGDFGVWQRGTSAAVPANEFARLADRWHIFMGGTYSATQSQQTFAPGTAPVAGYEGQYFWRNTISSITGSLSFHRFGQKIENVQTLAGQTVTISFWAKAAANASWTPQLVQEFGSGGSSAVFTSGSAVSITTSWQRFTQTISVPSIAGKTIGTGSCLTFIIDMPTTGAQTNDVWGVQVEAGSVATAFQTASGSLQGELALCQRYYWRTGPFVGPSDFMIGFGTGAGATGTLATIQIKHPVTLRVPATSLDFSGLGVQDGTNSRIAATNVTLNERTTDVTNVVVTVASGITQYRPYFLHQFNNSTGYLGLSAEL